MQHIYVIYMPQRELYIRNVFKNIGIDPIFFPAVNGANLPSLDYLYRHKYLGYKFLKKKLVNEGFPNMDLHTFEHDVKNTHYINTAIKGVLALQLSYILVFEHFLSRNVTGHCFIFEDDIIYQPPKLWKQRLSNIITRELPHDYDIVNLGRCFDNCTKNKYYSDNLVISTYPFCTHSCGYSIGIMKYIMNNVLPMNEPCDMSLRKLYNGPKFKGFSASPPIFFQNKEFVSLLGNPRVMPECSEEKKITNKKGRK